MSTSREVVRDRLVVLLTAEMLGADKAKTVTGHKLESVVGKSPIVYIRSTGTLRTGLKSFTTDFPVFGFEVILYVEQANKDIAWTDAMACDRLDKLESLLAQVVETYRADTEWRIVEYSSESEVTERVEKTSGLHFYREAVPLVVALRGS